MFVMLFTGLSGSGKSTLANAVAEELKKRGILVDVIDGDETRKLIGGIMKYSREDRGRMGSINRAIGHYLVRNGINVIYALVCPYEKLSFFRGLLLIFTCILSRSICSTFLKSVPLGKFCLRSLLAFSTTPFCPEQNGSAKYTVAPIRLESH